MIVGETPQTSETTTTLETTTETTNNVNPAEATTFSILTTGLVCGIRGLYKRPLYIPNKIFKI